VVTGGGVVAGGGEVGEEVLGTEVPVPEPPDGTADPFGGLGVVVAGEAAGGGAGAGVAVGGAGAFAATGAGDGAAVAADDVVADPVATAAMSEVSCTSCEAALAEAVVQSSTIRTGTAASAAVIETGQQPSTCLRPGCALGEACAVT
jgi:hypothetical protein